jgi:DNA repair ATPase RecN
VPGPTPAPVREGAARAEVSAEFDTPPAWRRWLEDGRL